MDPAFTSQSPPKAPATSKKRIVKAALVSVVCWVLIFGSGVAWFSYNGLPQTLFGRQRGVEFCIGCGTQRSMRYTSLFGHTLRIAKSDREPTRQPENPSERQNCTHTFATIYAEDVEFSLDTFSLKRWTWGLPNDTDFWENPVVIRALGELRSAIPEHAFALFHQLAVLRRQARIPSEIQMALEGTNAVELTRLLKESFEQKGRTLPKPARKSTAEERPRP